MRNEAFGMSSKQGRLSTLGMSEYEKNKPTMMEGVEDDKESCEINSINKKNKGIIVFLKKMWILHKDALADA